MLNFTDNLADKQLIGRTDILAIIRIFANYYPQFLPYISIIMFAFEHIPQNALYLHKGTVPYAVYGMSITRA